VASAELVVGAGVELVVGATVELVVELVVAILLALVLALLVEVNACGALLVEALAGVGVFAPGPCAKAQFEQW